MNLVIRALRSTAITVFFASGFIHAQVTSATKGNDIVIANQALTIRYHVTTGKMDVDWRDGHRLTGAISAVKLEDGRRLATSDYSSHALVSVPQTARGGTGREFIIVSRDTGKPELKQHLWLAQNKPWFSIRLELDRAASSAGTKHIDALLLDDPDSITVRSGAELRVLHVPFDNDMWFRYDSEPLANLTGGKTFSSNEVTAIYDNASREGLVLGSIDHDVWKTSIDVDGKSGGLGELDIYGGITSPTGVRTDTHDTIPHGVVKDEHVMSPRVFVGSFKDWRDGLEAYGEANAAVHPPLPWSAGVPMGWNSWAAYADKISYERYLNAATYVHDQLMPQGFGQGKVIYINLDAFWSRLDAVQLADAVKTIKSMHGPDGTRFEPGIYWTPFAYWSDDLDAWVEGTGMKYRYRDILLKGPDGEPLPKVDGGRPIDPSHPGALMRIDFTMKQFEQMGFTYLKLDFLSHGALEGVHFDPKIQTGIEAYNLGMQRVVRDANGHMFLSLSIAPLFPSGYGNARRLSCDTKGHIDGDQSTEYMLNSLTYGWWTSGNLFIADPDHVVLGEKADNGARNVAEGKSRLMSAIISGGMILDSSRLADDPQGRDLAKQVYDNPRLFAVANEAKAFRPVEGDTGNKAASAFVRKSSGGYYLAVFNYDGKKAQTIDVPVERIDANLHGAHISLADVATGQPISGANDTISISLQPAESKLIEVKRVK